jgi:hypothetical protein
LDLEPPDPFFLLIACHLQACYLSPDPLHACNGIEGLLLYYFDLIRILELINAQPQCIALKGRYPAVDLRFCVLSSLSFLGSNTLGLKFLKVAVPFDQVIMVSQGLGPFLLGAIIPLCHVLVIRPHFILMIFALALDYLGIFVII